MADIRADDKLFAAVVQKTAVGTTELMAVLLRNPNGSGKTVSIKKIIYNNSHTVSSFLRLRVYVNPTVTSAGTAQTEVALDVGSGNTASSEVFLTPTISANGSLVADLMTLGGASSQDNEKDFPDGFQLRANNSLQITAVSDGTGRVANITIIWEES